MERTIDNQLVEVKQTISDMGQKALLSLEMVIDGLRGSNPQLLQNIKQIEKQINDLHIKVDNDCMMVLAKQGPVARDLRMILAIIKMNTDLERIGDQCVNISYLVRDMNQRGFKYDPTEIVKMSMKTSQMVSQALDSFREMNLEKAQSVLAMDDEVDSYRTSILKYNIEQIKKDAIGAETYLDIIFIAKNLERLGDHATNVVEDVIFALSGKDIRHGS